MEICYPIPNAFVNKRRPAIKNYINCTKVNSKPVDKYDIKIKAVTAIKETGRSEICLTKKYAGVPYI